MAGDRHKPVDPKLTRRQTDKARAAIRTSQLINLLQDNAQNKLKTPQGHSYELSAGRIKSAQIVLAKVLPDTKYIETVENKDPPSKQELEGKYQELLEQAIKEIPEDTLLKELATRKKPVTEVA